MSDIDISDIETQLSELNSTNSSILIELESLNKTMDTIDKCLHDIFLEIKYK